VRAPQFVAGARQSPPGEYDVDVVILALDRADETIAAIHSALSQTGVSRHVVIVDQGSGPETLDRFAEVVRGRDDTTLIAAGSNLGVPGGRNLGTAFGHGSIVVGLDNDAELDQPDTLARIAAAFGDDLDLGALGCRIVIHQTGDDDMSSWGYPTALLPRSRETFETATFVGAGHAIRREAWNDAGGYDALLFFCWEEYDFCLRAIARFWRIRYRGDIVVRHKVSPERRVAWSGDRWFHYVRNRIYIGRKSGQSWVALLPRMLAYCAKSARNGCLRDRPRALWAAFRMSRTAPRHNLPPVAQDYLYRTDTIWRGGLLTRFRSEVLTALPGVGVVHGQATDASIRAMTSDDGGPASAAETHSASS
jgi:GT2 family glycosyltransferase